MKDQVVAILDMYLGGQAVGGAAVDILFGDVNPSGKLAESMPYRLEDTPCYLNFPGDGKKVYYSEGVFVGYRYYDSKRMGVMYPFGHGLSYTKFSIGDIKVSDSLFDGKGTVNVSVKVKNIGNTVGAEVVQLYISPFDELLRIRPLKELKGFEKVYLMPEKKELPALNWIITALHTIMLMSMIGMWSRESIKFLLETAAGILPVKHLWS